MKVYKFDLHTDYGAGVALVAAKSEESAKELMSDQPSGLGWWELSYTQPNLTYNGKTEKVIISEYYQE